MCLNFIDYELVLRLRFGQLALVVENVCSRKREESGEEIIKVERNTKMVLNF